MVKFHCTITIDPNILNSARMQRLNISQICERALAHSITPLEQEEYDIKDKLKKIQEDVDNLTQQKLVFQLALDKFEEERQKQDRKKLEEKRKLQEIMNNTLRLNASDLI